MLEKEFEFFKKNQESLVKDYDDKFIVIVGDKVVGSFDTMPEAYVNTKKERELGTFLIQHCIAGKEAYTVTFHSNVKFQ